MHVALLVGVEILTRTDGHLQCRGQDLRLESKCNVYHDTCEFRIQCSASTLFHQLTRHLGLCSHFCERDGEIDVHDGEVGRCSLRILVGIHS